MSQSSSRTPLLVILVALVLFAIGAWGFYSSDGATKAREREARLADAESSGPEELAPTLDVRTIVARTIEAKEIVELSGVLEPVRATWVAAELAGRITEVPVAEFSPIQSGDVLARLDSALPRAELIRAEASHAFAKTELERQERLGSQSVASKAELERASAEERRAYAALLEARTRLGFTRIKAPFDGIVNALDLDPGAYVQPGARIAEILDVSEIEIKVLVSDRQIGSISEGMDARIRIDSLGSERFDAKIVRVGRAPSSGGQRYPVVASLDNAAGRFRPGMLAVVLFEVGARKALRLPVGALVREFELEYVFSLDETGTAKRQRVVTRPVPFRPDQIEILEGVAENDRIAITAVDQLRDGLRVRVQ
ncbi:MAG: efflux RND transporter periplasmic adaptor subunit [Myxococcota bacterium]